MEKIAPWNDPNIRWVCEKHQTEDQSYKVGLFSMFECGGAGMPESEENRWIRQTVIEG